MRRFVNADGHCCQIACHHPCGPRVNTRRNNQGSGVVRVLGWRRRLIFKLVVVVWPIAATHDAAQPDLDDGGSAVPGASAGSVSMPARCRVPISGRYLPFHEFLAHFRPRLRSSLVSNTSPQNANKAQRPACSSNAPDVPAHRAQPRDTPRSVWPTASPRLASTPVAAR